MENTTIAAVANSDSVASDSKETIHNEVITLSQLLKTLAFIKIINRFLVA